MVNKELLDKLSILIKREIYSVENQNYLANIIAGVNNPGPKPADIQGVAVVTCTNRQRFMHKVFDNYARQKYEPKEHIIILNKNDMDIGIWQEKSNQYKNTRIFQLHEQKSLGERLNYGISRSSYGYIAKFDDDNYYVPNFTTDIMNAFKYTDAEVVGKYSYFGYFEGSKNLVIFLPNVENKYVGFICGSAFIAKKEVFQKIPYTHTTREADTVFIKECVKNGIKIYAIDRFNYVCVRRANVEDHTWKVSEEEFLYWSEFIAHTDDYIPYVTV